MPPKKAKPRPVTWKVTGGAQSGGLIVRKGPETKSEEFAERLATGTVIQELEVQGERMRYKRVKGSGPDEGWIGTKFKGKDQLKPRKLKAWIFATGTRGDIQPYLALACGMQEAGYDMTIWTCEDYKDFVENFGIRMHSIAGSCEALIRGEMDNKNDSNNKKRKSMMDMDGIPKEMMENFNCVCARWSLSFEFKKTVGGIDSTQILPPEVEETWSKLLQVMFYKSRGDVLAWLGETKQSELYHERGDRLAQELQQEEEASKADKDAGAGDAEKSPADGAAPPVAEDAPLDWDAVWKQAQEEEEWSSLKKVFDFGSMAGLPPEVAGPLIKVYLSLRKYWQEERSEAGFVNVMRTGMEGLFLNDCSNDESYLNSLREEIDKRPPDIVLYNVFWLTAGITVEAYCDIPGCFLHLQPDGLIFDDCHAPWISMQSQAWEVVQKMNPALAEFPTVELARQHMPKPTVDTDWGSWIISCNFEDLIWAPKLGTHVIRDMGPWSWTRRMTERHVVGFLRSIASPRFLSMMGEASTERVSKHIYTGFWIMPEKHQTGSSSADMFGGAELMSKIEDFIAGGEAPAYIGWGSCKGGRGRHWMCALAVAALYQANMRGIILGGWADLTFELLEELVGSEDALGLLEYAKKNVLFIKKAPQVWLFPKCSVVVIHGGVGTLAAAWTSGTPLIVCPVWLDQFSNSWLNALMGAGVPCSSVDECSAKELAERMLVAKSSPEVKRGAEAVQFSMLLDKGIQAAMEHFDSILLEDVPSGKFREWYSC